MHEATGTVDAATYEETRRLLADATRRADKAEAERDQAWSLLETANGLWWYWRATDITRDDDLWAEFTNAVHAHLDKGAPAPTHFRMPVKLTLPRPSYQTVLDLAEEVDDFAESPFESDSLDWALTCYRRERYG